MSDYDPRHYDQYGNRTSHNSNMDYDAADGRGPYILLAILVVIGVIGGILYFNHSPNRDQTAQAPASDTMKTPTPPALPGKATTTTPAAPSPATPANPSGATAPTQAPKE